VQQNIYDMLVQAQSGSKDSMCALIKKFAPAFYKYALELHYEDAYCDLVAELISAVHSIRLDNLRNREDPAMINYIWAIIYHAYIAIGKREKQRVDKIIVFDDMDNISIGEDGTKSSVDFDNAILFSDFAQHLTKIEADVVYRLYYENYSVQEIASFYKISRQAVNKTKIRALNKLKKYFSS
jgi:RNA polymerase sigma factor (sigma-70 family)